MVPVREIDKPLGHLLAKGGVMTRNQPVSLGELITLFYREFLAIYGDEETAAVATSATINELMADQAAAGTVAAA